MSESSGHKEIYERINKLDERGVRNEQKIDALDEKIDKLEEKVDKVCGDIYVIKTNEMEHLNQRIIEGRIDWIKMLAATAGISVSIHTILFNWANIAKAVHDFLSIFFG